MSPAVQMCEHRVPKDTYCAKCATPAETPKVAASLAIPDPRSQPVPPGWVERVAAPVILGTEDWDHLDEYEARLRAFASYLESFDGDVVEFEKALRVVEKRRGDLLGSEKYARVRTFDSGASHDTQERWRKIARAWDQVWPLIRDAKEKRAVTQSAVLRIIEPSGGGPAAAPAPAADAQDAPDGSLADLVDGLRELVASWATTGREDCARELSELIDRWWATS